MLAPKPFALTLALALSLAPLSGAAQDTDEVPDDWLVAFTLSMAAAQYGGACQSGRSYECQAFAELWSYGQTYVGLAERCAAADDPFSAACAERQGWAEQILANFGPVQGLDELLETIRTQAHGDPWVTAERCLSSQFEDTPECQRHENFLELLRD